ncbi:hypothetical protein D6D00_10487, partial [Aureobasidium pullulans]
FANSQSLLEDVATQQKWSSSLGVPEAFWSKTCTRLNGFVGTSISPHNKTKPLERFDTWFRFIIKRLVKQGGPNEYEWVEMSYFSRWTDKTHFLICLDVPDDVPEKFVAALEARSGTQNSNAPLQPYALHVILMDLLVPLYDQSVWDLSKRIRTIEKNRELMTDTDFPGLHEVARHTAHATETVQVAGDVLERMASQCGILAQRQSEDSASEAESEEMYERFEMLRFMHSMMTGVAARSISNEKRLSNEINLVFNMMAQKDNDVNIDIAKATRIDSAAMKTIAVVTLTFLPATYVSALLGMNLFAFDPDTDNGHITYSSDLWIYFVISIPLTIFVLSVWWIWQRWEELREAKDRMISKGEGVTGGENASLGSK